MFSKNHRNKNIIIFSDGSSFQGHSTSKLNRRNCIINVKDYKTSKLWSKFSGQQIKNNKSNKELFSYRDTYF